MRCCLATGLLALVLATSCAAGTQDATADRGAGSSPTDTVTVPRSVLEGTWRAEVTPEAIIARVRASGWSRKVEARLLEPDMAGPPDPQFRLDFVGDQFRMSHIPTDGDWQHGRFEVRDGKILIDETGPGQLQFAFRVAGDTLTFSEPSEPELGPEFAPGVPGWAPAEVMWASVPWRRLR